MDANASPRLIPHSRIAIIGGGPAGSFFALAALQVATQLSLPLDITIFERKDLTAPGPKGCNMCAGILSRRVVEGLAALDIALPPTVVRERVRVYVLHWDAHSISIHPPDSTRQVLSVYRAGGPRLSPFPPAHGFDAFLLSQAQARGARVIGERVEHVSFTPLPRVSTRARQETFDLVVLAAGVNATPPPLEPLDYHPPTTETMAQDSLLVESASRVQMDGTVHVYLDEPPGLIFGALIPKRPFATVSLLGERLARDSIEQFLAVPQVTQVIGDQPPRLCGCRPRVAVAPARGFFADRFVAVGDSCVTRLYKDGIGSALLTARAAAETALRHGISRAAFAAHYAPVCQTIARDNRLGRVVFALVAHSKRNAWLMRGLTRALSAETDASPGARLLNQTLWSIFTGDANYAEILRMMFHPRSIAHMAKAMLQERRVP